MKKLLPRLPLLLVFLVAIAFSIKSLREPDLWWQIRTGEWILQNHQIPKTDIFSYTFAGKEWINIKWGWEVVAALIAKLCGPECIFILQAIVTCLILWLVTKTIRYFIPLPKEEYSLPLALLVILVACEYRFNGRPEMISHLFTVLFLFVLLKFRNAPSKKIFWLAPLQIVWANFHEAFGIGVVMMGIFCAGDWLQYLMAKRKPKSAPSPMPKNLSLTLVLAVAGIIINPHGVRLLTRPFDILGQVYENKYTTELLDYTSPEYWNRSTWWAVAILAIGVTGTLLHYRWVKTKSGKWPLFIQQFGIGYLLTVVAFIYLALTAQRNIILWALVYAPLFVFGLRGILNRIKTLAKYSIPLTWGTSGVAFVLYVLVVSDTYYTLTKSRDSFGMQVLATFNPIGAGNYAEQQHLQGPCFSDYLTSSYLLWKLQPNFKTFIDLRDLDVFTPDFFNTFTEAVLEPDVFEQLDSQYYFNYVVLYRPQFAALHNYLYNDSTYSLAFLDPVTAVYVKHRRTTAPVVATKLADNVSPLANVVNHVLNPLFKSGGREAVDLDYIYASYYISVGDLSVAAKHAEKSAQGNIENYKGQEILGEVYFNRALQAGSPALKDSLLNYSAACYEQSIEANGSFSPAYLGLGAVYFQQQNMDLALANFDKSIATDKENFNAYIYAGECCKYYINTNNDAEKNTQKAIAYYLNADRLRPNHPVVSSNLGFLYFRLNDCDKAGVYLHKAIDIGQMMPNDKKQAEACLRKCGK